MGKDISRRALLGAIIGTKAALCLGVLSKFESLSQFSVTNNDENAVYSIFSIRGKAASISFRNYRADQRLINYVPSNDANQLWFEQHVSLREKFSREGKLLGVSKYILGDELVIVNQWRKASDFQEFCRQTRINDLLTQLDESFIYSYHLSNILPVHLAVSKPILKAYA
jgi:hypothetical protein